MIPFLRSYWKTLLFFTLAGVVGGYFTGLYQLDVYPADLQQQLVDELLAAGLGGLPIRTALGLITALQSAGYGLVLGALGILFSKRVGLWREAQGIQGGALFRALGVGVIGGLVMIYADTLFFGRYSEAIMDSYATKPNLVTFLASVIYGGVIEEIMLRLFFLSLIALVISYLCGKKGESTTAILVWANVLSALLFAAGHLPATKILLGLSPLIVARCFLLNGGIGLLFGRLYRKQGIGYAMVAHATCHVVSKTIWLLFL